jgi:phosphatidylglycerophosphatase A
LTTKRSMEIRHKVLLFCVSCAFIGYMPFAPGTWASAFGAILVYLFPFSSLAANVVFTASLLVVSVVLVNMFNSESEDPGYIVIDELVGMYVTMTGHRPTVVNIAAGFLLFRFFDVVKPFPVRQAERLRKGYGVVADDVVAGILANLVLVVIGMVL